ncbi:MAG: FAD-dependent oxidoreductase [Alistipes sp.]|nr:FAD-dependent oxidoreductase [Candidatus Alistipes equi]
MKRTLFAVITLLAGLIANAASPVFIETENFQKKGGWFVDQQFMDLMGSPYLIAHGLGNPVENASTTFQVDQAQTYHIYARTFNWVSPWTESEGPGAFKIKVNNKFLKNILGTIGKKWMWQYAGSMKLKAGTNTIELCDLKGFDGRCDAIWITPSKEDIPPSDIKTLEAFRRKMGALPKEASDGGKYDLVVVGAGIGGMCAAVSAARLGMKVALINDRPKLGGNNSSEIRVHLGGRIEIGTYPALGRMIREFGHSTIGNAKPKENYEDEKKDAFIAAEPNITLFAPYRAVSVKMASPAIIGSVIIRSITSGEELELSAPLFSDCTGDGTIGFLAGADWMMGREGRDEFAEKLAPLKADKLTMGSSVQWYSEKSNKKTIFPEFEYGVKFTEENCEKVTMGEWTWETGMNYDQIYDFERIRDYGMLVIFSNWSYLKNHSTFKSEYSNLKLGWVAYLAGKRESRRLVGDYILKQDDVDKQVFHEDASFTTTWHFDLHFPDPANTKHFPGAEFKAKTKSNRIYPYAVPYRCLYSRNVNNLFMAGRNISVTHVTLGSTRLMRTIGMMGEVVGMAASICKKHDTLPRDVYQHHLPELKALMRIGTGKPAEELPDNQNFNRGGILKTPKNIIFSSPKKEVKTN